MQENQQIVFLSDGGEDVRNLQLYLNPQAEHLLDWFHVTMRLTVMTQTAKGLPEMVGEREDQQPLRSEVLKTIKSIKWYLWHGNGFQALRHLQFVEMDLEGAAFEKQEETTRKLLKAVEEFSTYIQRNRGFIPNYGERYRNGERISSVSRRFARPLAFLTKAICCERWVKRNLLERFASGAAYCGLSEPCPPRRRSNVAALDILSINSTVIEGR